MFLLVGCSVNTNNNNTVIAVASLYNSLNRIQSAESLRLLREQSTAQKVPRARAFKAQHPASVLGLFVALIYVRGSHTLTKIALTSKPLSILDCLAPLLFSIILRCFAAFCLKLIYIRSTCKTSCFFSFEPFVFLNHKEGCQSLGVVPPPLCL